MLMTGPDELLLLRALLRASDYGVLLSDAARRDLLCNLRFCELFDISPQTSADETLHDVRAQVLPRVKFPNEFLQVLEMVYADPHLTREDEVELIAPAPRLLRRYTAPVTDADGALIGRLWTFLDITRTRALEDKVQAQAAQLRVQARQLAAALKTVSGRLHKVENTLSLTQQQLFESEKLSAVGLLAASVAHDIRNILTPLTIEMRLADHNDPAERAESLNAMRAQVDRLSLMTHRLLSLARPQNAVAEPVDMAALARHVAALLLPQAKLDNVHVHLRVPRRPLVVLGDGVQLEQALVNLVLNGVQAMQQKGGTLSFSLSACPRPAQTPGVCIRVRDTGPGIPAAVRKRIFDPFFTTKPDGTGLGLFSCRRIVQAHAGSLLIRSGGRGTQAIVWLPCLPACMHQSLASCTNKRPLRRKWWVC